MNTTTDADDEAFLQGVGIDLDLIEKEDEDVFVDRGTYDNMSLFEDDIAVVTNCLGINAQDVDREYVIAIGERSKDFVSQIPVLVNKYTNQFMYEDMEITKKAIFTLGYAESRVLGTDTKVIINETIELAKRFGGADTFKLVNSIFHNLLVVPEDE